MKSLFGLTMMALALATPAAAQGGATPIGIGESAMGELTSTDLQAADSTYYDLYQFSGEAGQTVVITFSSTAFDAQISVLKGGATVASDDNGAGRTNAKITLTLTAAGQYDIRASAVDGRDGAYLIKVEAGAGR